MRVLKRRKTHRLAAFLMACVMTAGTVMPTMADVPVGRAGSTMEVTTSYYKANISLSGGGAVELMKSSDQNAAWNNMQTGKTPGATMITGVQNATVT
ncbi:MAG: hypothetical protein RR590_10495, partial [Hungatella sp.]